MQETKILLVDESRRSTDDIKPKLVDLGYVVDQAKSYVELVQLLSTFPIYAVVLVERDLPEEPEGKRKLVGMEIVREISARFPMAQIILFEGGTESSENDIDPVFYKLIDRHLSVSHIIREIQQAQQLTLQRQLETAGIQLHQINKITTALLTSQSKEEIFKTIVNGLASFGFDRIQLYFLSSNGKSLEGVAQYGMQNETEFLKHPWESNYLKELLVKQAQPKPVIYRGDEAKGILDYETKMGRSGLKEWAIFPVAMNGEFMGIIAVDNLYSGRQITQDELAPLIGIASQAVIAIENLELRQREARKSHLMHVIHAVASDINRLVNLQEVYQAVSQAVVDLFDNVDHSGLVIFDNSYRYGKVVSEYPQSMGSKGTVMPIAGIPFGHELLTGAPFVKAEDVERDESLGEVGQTLTSLGIKSILLIPLRHNDRLIGSFGLDSTVRKHTFTQDEIEMAQIFATHVSAAVVNSRRLDEVTALNTIAQAMNRVTKLEDLLELIVSYAVDSVSGRSGGIHLIDYERNIIILMADENRSSSHETILNLDEGMAGYMLINGHAYLVTPNYAEESYASDLFKEKLGYGALIKVRLDHNNSPIGFLYVDDEVGREFSPEDASRLQAFVALAGSAVYQSQLLEKQRNLAKQLEVLHRIGDVIESATDIQIVVDYSLIALTATYALNFDRCAYFLIDSQNPNLLRGKAGYGYFTKIEWEQHAKDLVAKGILDRSSHEKAYVAGELEETPFNQPVREISIDLSSDEAVFLRELLAVEFVWYYPDQRKQFIKQMPRAIQTLFDDEGPAVIVPMAAGGELIGVLIVDNPFSQRTSDSPHLRALKTFVSSTAVAINRLRLFQHEQKQAEQLQSLFEISQQAAKLEDASKTIETIIDKLKEVSGAENVAFIRVNLDHLDPERLYLWAPTTIYSVKPIDAPSEWMRSGGFSVSVLKNGHSKLIDDLALETAADFGYAKGVLNMRAAACLPAITNEKQIGVIWFYFAQTKTFDSQQEIKLWQLFVNQVATLYQLHSDFDKLEAEKRLSEGVQNMVVANDLNGVYDQVVKQVQGVLEKQDKRVSVALYGFDGEQIDITHTACTFGTSSFLEQNITVQQPAELVYRLLSKENMISFSVNPHKKDA
ncbi:MAG: GAF domain-containing protein/CheY-like chemotaxis protein, partial [Cellvibrionaceae bacterium]